MIQALLVLCSVTSLTASASGGQDYALDVVALNAGTGLMNVRATNLVQNPDSSVTFDLSLKNNKAVWLNLRVMNEGTVIRDDQAIADYFDNLLSPGGTNSISDTRLRLKEGRWVHVLTSRYNNRSRMINILDGICMLFTGGSRITDVFWKLIIQDPILLQMGFTTCIVQGDLSGATYIFWKWLTDDPMRIILIAQQCGMNWTTEAMGQFARILKLVLAAKNVLPTGWDTFLAPIEDRVTLTAVPRDAISWDAPGPTQVNVNQQTGIAIRVYNRGAETLHRVWLGMDIHDPTGTKVENTRTPIPDTGQGGTGRIGWLDFGDTTSGQGVDIPPGGYHIFNLKVPYRFLHSVTGHYYRGGTYQYHYFIWENGYPGQPGAVPLNDDIAITDLKVIGATSPTAPTCACAGTGNKSVQLSWAYNTSGNEWDIVKYRVYRSHETQDAFVLWDSVPSPVSVYEDTLVVNGNTYCYKVAAVNSAGLEGAWSVPLLATPTVDAPTEPGHLVASPGNTAVYLSWTASQPGGKPIRSYRLYRGTSSGGQASSPVDSVLHPTTSYTDTRVVNGTTYYYYVRAADNGNPPVLSGKSNEASATPSAGAVPPPTPTGLAATAGNQQVTLNWTANPSGTHRYRVYRSLSGGGSYTLIDSVYHPTVTYTNTGLTNGTVYYYKLSAVNSAGQASALTGNVSAKPVPPNSSPTLSGEYASPSSPRDGEIAAVYVTYRDPDGQSPAWVKLYNDAGGMATLVCAGPFPLNYRTGVNYCGGMSWNGAGSHGYHFVVSDGVASVRYPASGEIPITIQARPPEQPLQLDSAGSSPRIISPLVSPDTADRCTLRFKLNASAVAQVKVLASDNSEVRTLAAWDSCRGGVLQRKIWDGRNDAGSPVQDGSYFFEVKASDFDRLVAARNTGSSTWRDIAADTSLGRFYLADGAGCRIVAYSRSGSLLFSFGSNGGGPGQFRYPNGVAVDQSGHYIWVADYVRRDLQKFTSSGTWVATYQDLSHFLYPIDCALDANGNVYVVAERDFTGTLVTLAKYDRNFNFVRADTNLIFPTDQSTEMDCNGRYLALPRLATRPGESYRIRVYDTTLAVVSDFASSFQHPAGIMVDQYDKVIEASLNQEIGKHSLNGTLEVKARHYDHQGALYVYGLALDAGQCYYEMGGMQEVNLCKNGWAQAIGRVNPVDPLYVQVDNSPPLTDMNYPDPGDSVSDVVRTIGTALDANFKQYSLEYSSGKDGGSWSLIKTDTVTVDSGPLGDWNTNELPNGDYRLKLTTADDAYNIDTLVLNVTVNHTPPGVGIDTVYPAVFSPNGDGLMDTVTLGYTLDRNALVTINVLDANNAVARILASGQPKPAGANTAKWDGKNGSGAYVGDGQYKLLLVGSDSVNNPSVADTALVAVDRAKPTVAITAPSSGSLLNGLVSFNGTATDANPLCREMYYGVGASPDSWIRWDSSGSVVVSGLLAMLCTPNLSDTTHTFKLLAQDQAGNKDSASVGARIDNTRPNPPALISPHDTAAFQNRNVTFAWGRTTWAGDKPLNPDMVTYTFQLGKDFRFITFDTTVVLTGETTWVCPRTLADTTYYWHVRATDSAGNEGFYQNYPFEFAVDNISPGTPALVSPADSTIIEDTIVSFCWRKSAESGSGIRHYVLRISDNPGFPSYRDTLVLDTTFVWRLPDSLYYWKAQAVDRAGNQSSWPSARRFVKDVLAPTVPAPVSPPNLATVNDSTPRFVWHKATLDNWSSRLSGTDDAIPDGSPVHYTLECALDTAFTTGLVRVQNIRDSFVDLPDSLALSDTVYYWHVEAIDEANHQSGFSSRWSFRVKAYFDISGRIRYYSNQTPVPSVNVVLSGFRSDTVATGDSGDYALATFPVLQNYAVAPYRIEALRSGAVSAFDAAMVLKHVVHIDTLDSLQQIAGDVTGGGISSMDAAKVLQYSVGVIRHFPVGYRPGLDTVDWAFRPPSRSYTMPTQNQVNHDYMGILYGDPSGDWPPVVIGGEPPELAQQNPTAFFSLNMPGPEAGVLPAVLERPASSTQGETGSDRETEVFEVAAREADAAVSADILLRYDARKHVLVGVRTSDDTRGYMVAATDWGGVVRVAMAGTRPLDGDVVLLELVFKQVSADIGELSAVRGSSSDCSGPLAVSRQPLAEVIWLILNEGREPRQKTADEGAMGDRGGLPATFYLGLARPNPFGRGTSISYGLQGATDVALSVYDASGRCVRTLIEGAQAAGRYDARWDGKAADNRQTASGVYFIRLEAGEFRGQRKVTLLGR